MSSLLMLSRFHRCISDQLYYKPQHLLKVRRMKIPTGYSKQKIMVNVTRHFSFLLKSTMKYHKNTENSFDI